MLDRPSCQSPTATRATSKNLPAQLPSVGGGAAARGTARAEAPVSASDGRRRVGQGERGIPGEVDALAILRAVATAVRAVEALACNVLRGALCGAVEELHLVRAGGAVVAGHGEGMHLVQAVESPILDLKEIAYMKGMESWKSKHINSENDSTRSIRWTTTSALFLIFFKISRNSTVSSASWIR